MTLILLTIFAYSTQNEALFSGNVPENVPTFQVTVRGSEPFYAGVRVNGKWLDDPSTEVGARQEVELIPDVPWRTQDSYKILYSKVEMKYEANAMRRDRLHKTLAAQGYSVRETASGWFPVRDSDALYAERMRKIQTAARESAALAVPTEEVRDTAQDAAMCATMRRRWLAAMIALPVAGLVAIFFVARKMLFGADSFQKV